MTGAAGIDYRGLRMGTDHDDRPAGGMGFLDHLDELRRRLIYSVVAILVGFPVCWIFSEPIFDFLAQPIKPFLAKGDGLAFTKLADPFLLYMKVAF